MIEGEFLDNQEPIDIILSNCTSLHVVEDNESTLSCDCKMFHHTGHICSHILVVEHSKNVINLLQKVRPITKSSKPGRKRPRTEALQTEENSDTT